MTSRLLMTVLLLLVAAAAIAAGPPDPIGSHLTPNGRTLWNLDALINDTFRLRTPCVDLRHDTFYSVAPAPRGDCTGPTRPATSHYAYVYTFVGAQHSEFRLVALAREPNTGATNVPLRIRGRYISCPISTYHPGKPGWLVFGGGLPPNAEIWCN